MFSLPSFHQNGMKLPLQQQRQQQHTADKQTESLFGQTEYYIYHIIYHIISYIIYYIIYHIISYYIILYHIISFYISYIYIILNHILSYHIISYMVRNSNGSACACWKAGPGLRAKLKETFLQNLLVGFLLNLGLGLALRRSLGIERP